MVISALGHLLTWRRISGGEVIIAEWIFSSCSWQRGMSFSLNHKLISLAEALSGAGFILLGVMGITALWIKIFLGKLSFPPFGG